MSSPNIIIKSGYITSHEHVVNTLVYAGNKIATQKIMFKDGSSVKVAADKKIVLTSEKQAYVSGIHVEYKDGGCKKLSYDTYIRLTEEDEETVTVDKLTGVEDDEALLANESGKRYHKMEDLDFFKYLPYIEGRPGAEKSDGHGLFGLTGDISIEEATQTALKYKDSRKWSHIISLDADGAKRTGYDNREAWKSLIISKAPKIAEEYNINDLHNFVISCAFHSNTDNPHVHLIFYSKDKSEGFVKGGTNGMNEASEALKSMLNNAIFKDDVATLTKEKSASWESVRKSMLQHVNNINAKDYSYTEINMKLHELAEHIQTAKEESRSYGYLSPELKSEVSDILRQMISKDKDMHGLFEKYLDSQRKIISQYVSDEKVLAAKLLDFESRFFAPDKKKNDSTWYHNKIVEAAKQIASLEGNILSSPPAAVAPRKRATKVINANSATSSVSMSTESYGSSQFYKESQDYFTAAGEALTPLDADATPEDGGELPEPPEYISAAAVPRERATKRDKADFTTSKSALSRNFIYDLLKDESDCINNKSFSKIYRKAFDGIYNPKLEKSELQVYLVTALENLGNVEEKSRRKPPAKQHAKNIFNALYNEKTDFEESIDTLFENSYTVLSAVIGDEKAQEHLDKFESDMLSPAVTNTAQNYIFYFAETLQDQKYYQLLGAYSEFNKPLNKALYKGLRKTYDSQDSRPQFLKQLRELQQFSKYLDDEDANAQVCGMVRGLFANLINDADVSPAFKEYENNYLSVISAHIDEPEEYCKQFSNNLRSVKRLMRPHYSVIRFAENYQQFVFDKVSRDKDIHKDSNSMLYSCLRDALTDTDTYSSELIRQELERFDVSRDNKHLSSIFKYLYSTDEAFRQETDKTIEAAYTRLKNELGTTSALSLIDKYKENLFECKDEASHSWLMKHFVNNLGENYYSQITLKHKGILKPLSKALFGALQSNITCKGLMPKLNELQALMNQKTPEDTEVNSELDKRIIVLSADIFKYLRSGDISSIIDECCKGINPFFSLYCNDPNLRLVLDERLYGDLYHGEYGTIQFIVQSFAKNLSLHQTKYVLKEMKPEISEFKSKLFKHLRKAFIRGNSQVVDCLRQMKADTQNSSAFSLLLQNLSDSKTDFNDEKEKLYQCFTEKMIANNFNYPPKQMLELFDSFFYGKNESKYETMFFKETALNAYEQKDKIIAGFAINTLLQSLSCLMRDQTENAEKSTRDRGKNHLRKKPLQFKRIAPEHEYQPNINMSY